MKTLILSLLVCVACMGGGLVYADDTVEPINVPSLNLPDMQAGVVYSAKTGNFEPAFTATVLKYPSKIGDIELRAGYAMESEPIGAICFKVGDLTKYGFVQPLHNILNVSAGPYVGYDFQTEEWDYGALVTIINLQF